MNDSFSPYPLEYLDELDQSIDEHEWKDYVEKIQKKKDGKIKKYRKCSDKFNER